MIWISDMGCANHTLQSPTPRDRDFSVWLLEIAGAAMEISYVKKTICNLHDLKQGDHIRVIRGISKTHPHGTYDHHMLVIAVIDATTLLVIHYTGEVADAAAGTAVISFSSFGGSLFGSRSEDVDCDDRAEGEARAAIQEHQVKVDARTEKVELLEYPSNICLYSPDKAIERARSRLGEKEYSVFKNNCECFVNWAITGKAVSNQFEQGKWEAGLGAVLGAWSGYKKGGWAEAAKGAAVGAHEGYQNYREKRP